MNTSMFLSPETVKLVRNILWDVFSEQIKITCKNTLLVSFFRDLFIVESQNMNFHAIIGLSYGT